MWAASMKEIGSSFEMGIVASRTFRGEVAVLPLGKVQLGSASTVADGVVRVVRSDALIAKDQDDRIMIVINRSKTPMRVVQYGRAVNLAQDAMAVLAMDVPSESSTPRGGASNVVLMPRELFDQPGRMLERHAATSIAAEIGAQRLLCDHVRDLLACEASLSESLEAAAGHYIVSLANIIFRLPGAATPRAPVAEEQARLAEIRKQIAKRYREHDLSPAALSKSVRLSERSIQHLLRKHGTTFTRELTAIRLEAAYAALSSADIQTPIADISFRCGFAELSTFYRAFRARYGQTPNSLRAGQSARAAVARRKAPGRAD